MKKMLFLIVAIIFITVLYTSPVFAQCSICSKTVQQMGSKPGNGFNSGIIYLMLVPYAAISVIGYKWWKSNH